MTPPPKSDEAFRTIREVSDWLGVPTHVLRFWESKFDQIAPVKGAGGRRYYRPEDMRLLGGIKTMLHDRGQTIRAVAQQIDEEGTAPVIALSPPLEMSEGPPKRTRRVIRDGDEAPRPAPTEVVPADVVPVTPPQPAEPGRGADAPAVPSAILPDQPEPEFEDRPQPAEPAEAASGGPEIVDPPETQLEEAPRPEVAAPSHPLDELRRRAARGRVAPADRPRVRRLRRRLMALADEIRDDLRVGADG